MPPEHVPHMLTSGLPVILRRVDRRIEGTHVVVQAPVRCSTVGLRQLTTNSCTPESVAHLTRLLSGVRSMA